jgi:dihydrofolate synthase/folylpolyglutamate synthase
LVRAADAVCTDVRFADGRAQLTLTTPHRRYDELTLALAGAHQIDNCVCAVRVLEELNGVEAFDIPAAAIRSGVEDVEWPGRLERMTVAGVDVIVDGAHNPAGARALARHIHATFARRLPIVVGVMRDKDGEALLHALAPAASCFVVTAASTPRAAPPADLAATAARVAPDVPVVDVDCPVDAVTMAARFGSPVVVAGSLYLAGEIRAARS